MGRVDSDGCVWNAEWGSAMVRRYTPHGVMDRAIAVPTKNPKCVVFGGTGLDELYVTSSRQEMSREKLEGTQHAGGVYRVRPGRDRYSRSKIQGFIILASKKKRAAEKLQILRKPEPQNSRQSLRLLNKLRIHGAPDAQPGVLWYFVTKLPRMIKASVSALNLL